MWWQGVGGGEGESLTSCHTLATRIEVVSTKTRPLRLRGGGAWQGLEGGGGGKRGVGGGIAMSSIGGLNFPAVWGVASGRPG